MNSAKVSPASFSKNPLLESILDNVGIVQNQKGLTDMSWRFMENVPANCIDVSRSRANQARFTTDNGTQLLEETLNSVRQGIATGNKMPAIAVFEEAPNNYTIWDGNHRDQESRNAGYGLYNLYIVKCSDSSMRDRLTTTVNDLVNGQRLDESQRLAHAIRLVGQNVPRSDVAKLYNLSEGQIYSAYEVYQARQRFANVDGVQILDEGRLKALGAAFRGLGGQAAKNLAKEVVANPTVPTKVINDLTSKAKTLQDSNPSEYDEFLANIGVQFSNMGKQYTHGGLLRKSRKGSSVTGKRGGRKTVKAKVKEHLGALTGILNIKKFSDFRYTAQEEAEVISMIDKLASWAKISV